ncbi:MAG TPA: VCBS repeat-containing protein [Terracidiphilus sp.]|nr:VCBS repeat-containing protein [Terracidiphilus sp.]
MYFPRCVAIAFGLFASTVLSTAQAPAGFEGFVSPTNATPANIYAVDVNNDGMTDIVQDTAQSPSAFTVNINNGGAGWSTPFTYNLPVSSTLPMPIATADFNNDGNVDIAVVLVNTSQIAVYLGRGDGSFQAPVISTVSLPSGWHLITGGAAAADFNANGNVDLVAWTGNYVSPSDEGTTALYVFEGDGNGNFSNPQEVLAGPSFQLNFQTFVGDYDSDGKADIAATTYTQNNDGSVAVTTMHVLYGNNDFTFEGTTPYMQNGPSMFVIGSGDLNSDGYTDLYGLYGTSASQLATFYGNSSRTFTSYFMNLATDIDPVGATPDGASYTSQLTMADFNGDVRMDLAAIAWNADSTQAYLAVFLAGANPGQFTEQLVALPSTYLWETTPVAGLFSGGFLTPDIVLNQSPNGGSPPQNTPSFLDKELNEATSGYFGPCSTPEHGEGFNVCNAGTVDGSTALFGAAVNSFGKLRKVELWVDGVKVQEQYHIWDQHAFFEWASTFPSGTHFATFYAADIDNRLQRYDFSFTIP